MTGIQSSLYTVAIALCVFSAGILRDQRARTGHRTSWFTTFLLVATTGLVFELLMIHPATPLKALWLGLRMANSLLIAPCLWLAVKESVEGKRSGLSSLGRCHLAAILTGFALLLPLIVRAHFGLEYNDPSNSPGVWHSRLIHGAMLGCIAIFAVQVPCLLWHCRRLLIDANPASKWLQLPLLVVLTTWLLGLLRTLHCMTHTPRGLDLVFAVIEVGVTVGTLYLIVQRTTVETPEEETADEAANDHAYREDIAVPRETKYARSCLDPATRERIRRKLETALATPAVSQDSLLNLRSLGRTIGEKAHYLSQVINQDLNSSFYELLNKHRIAHAKRLLMKTSGQTVLEIALAVGFNAKSTFNTAFRKHTGMTPSEFRLGKLPVEGTQKSTAEEPSR